MKVPPSKEAEGEDDEPKTREVTEDEAENMASVILNAYACQGVQHAKKVALQTSLEPQASMREMVSNPARAYLEIVDFDDHFENVALDWTNPDFE